jgi:hypothetical protein
MERIVVAIGLLVVLACIGGLFKTQWRRCGWYELVAVSVVGGTCLGMLLNVILFFSGLAVLFVLHGKPA